MSSTAQIDLVPRASHEDELTRLEILRSYKELFGGDLKSNHSPFAEDRVVKYDTDIEPWDVPTIYQEARDTIERTLRELHIRPSSNVVVLAGEAGMGKSHLINHFRNPQLQEEIGYVLVGNSNHWKIDEFERCLVTSMVAELLHKDAKGRCLLQDRMEAIGFQGLEQILRTPGKINEFVGKRKGLSSRWGRLGRMLRGDMTARFTRAVSDRDASIFAQIDFIRFANFIGERFLHQRDNPFHQFVLHVLLRYLYPSDRRYVAAWLAAMNVDDAFIARVIGAGKSEPRDPDWPTPEQSFEHLQERIGIGDRLDCNYKVTDTIKILINLFGPTAPFLPDEPRDPHSRVCFFAFDQIEGRNELFDSEADWFRFFAKLSELYNSLPNIYIVFTMTLGLRNELYPKMEKQFRQRIHRDQKFVLDTVDDSQILAVYRRHIERWRGNHLAHLEEHFAEPRFQYLPFELNEVLEMGRKKSIREMQSAFDTEFRAYLIDKVRLKEARQEYLIALNDFRESEGKPNSHKFVANHLDVVTDLFKSAADSMASVAGLRIRGFKTELTEEKDPAILFECRCDEVPDSWIRVYLGLVPYAFAAADRLIKLLAYKQTDRYFLWLLRGDNMRREYENRKPGQVFARTLEDDTHSRFLALRHLLAKGRQIEESGELSKTDRAKFTSDTLEIVQNEIKNTYFGELMIQTRTAFSQLKAGGSDAIS